MLRLISAALAGCLALLGGMLMGMLIASDRYNIPIEIGFVPPSPSPSFTLHVGEGQ